MRFSGERRALSLSMIIAGLIGVCALIIIGFIAVKAGAGQGLLIVAIIAAIGMIAALWVGIGLIDRHFDDLDRLRGALLSGNLRRWLQAKTPLEKLAMGRSEIGKLSFAVDQALLPDDQLSRDKAMLTELLALLPGGVIVVSHNLQITMVAAAVQNFFGKKRAAIGASLLGLFDADSLEALIKAGDKTARKGVIIGVKGQKFHVTLHELADEKGYILQFDIKDIQINAPAAAQADKNKGDGLILMDFRYHDVPPQGDMQPDTPLDKLPILSLDCETTGLDIEKARLLQFGAVSLFGGKIYPASMVEFLVNPQEKIPADSTRIHGITDIMVAEIPPFDSCYDKISTAIAGRVVLGHNIGFDLAIIEKECARHGLAWQSPNKLDTILLAGALFPNQVELDLDKLAPRFGIEALGRHTALGDALTTAELYQALLPLLKERGIVTYGQALAFSMTAKRVLRRQAQMGW